MPRINTTAELERAIRVGAPLEGLSLRGVRGERLMGPLTDEDRERVVAAFGEDGAVGRLVRFVFSSEQRAKDGHVIYSDGWDLEEFNTNPRVYHMHRWWADARVGDAVPWVDAQAKRLMGVVAFYPREVNPTSYMLGEMAALRGYATSVSWDTVEAEVADEDTRKTIPWALNITKARLREVSLVSLPSDTEALSEARAAGIDTAPAAEAFERLLDTLERTHARLAKLEALWAAAAPDRPVVVDMKPRSDDPVALEPAPEAPSLDLAAVIGVIREGYRRSFGPRDNEPA